MFPVPHTILQKMKCKYCKNTICFAPVYRTKCGENLCGNCNSLENNLSRNTIYEEIAQLFYYPCKFEADGCLKLLKWSESLEHEKDCAFGRVIPCISNEDCEWKGCKTELYEHYQRMHKHLIATKKGKLPTERSKNMLIKVYNFLFVLHLQIPKQSDCKLQVTILDVPYLAPHFEFRLEVNNTDKIFRGNDIFVGPVNKIFDKDFTKNIVTFTRSFNCAISLKRIKVMCLNCRKELEKLSKNNGKYCCLNPNFISVEKFQSKLRRCVFSSIGCHFVDIPENLNKHQMLFCKFFFGGKCSSCNFSVQFAQKSMFDHEIEKHHITKFTDKIVISKSRVMYRESKNVQLLSGKITFLCKWGVRCNLHPISEIILRAPIFVIHILSDLPHNEDSKINFVAKFQELSQGAVIEKKFTKQLSKYFNSLIEEWYVEFGVIRDEEKYRYLEFSLEINFANE